MNNQDDRLERLLSDALEGEVPNDPLPAGFGQSLVARLPERRTTGLFSTLGQWLAVAVAAAALAVGVVWGQSMLSRGPQGSSSVVRYQTDGFSFEYPNTWSVISTGALRRYEDILVVVGIGNWAATCVALPSGSGRCDPITFEVPPGGVVVEVSRRFGPGPPTSPSPGAIDLPNGGRADVTESELASAWQIVPPGAEFPIVVEAHYSATTAEESRAQVRSLVLSLTWAESSIGHPTD